ncbi:MAG: hypothetical protein ACD_43C00030G0008 [uncultured bacterium]|nr:MAG: hypothetical protein ACD_43C00030G0008 [uncultured bacterium]
MIVQCMGCSEEFKLDEAELQFYQKIDVPVPTLCSNCRKQQRFVWRNERYLYKRQCDLSGQSIVSVYQPGTPYKVYEHKLWWSDQWDPLTFGRDFDFTRSFFEQFSELYQTVPKMSMMVNDQSENCDYSLYLDIGKNCYLCVSGAKLEDCHYCFFCQEDKNCLDCSCTGRSELCYDTVDCVNCYKVFHSQSSHDCIDSAYLFNCRNCQNCTGCTNLKYKQYYIFNQPFSREEYFATLAKLTSAQIKVQFDQLKQGAIRRAYEGIQNENVRGNYISNCKNAVDCFDVEALEDCRYLVNGQHARDTYDSEFFWEAELCYQCMSMFQNNRCMFNDFCWTDQNVAYSSYCFNSQNLFGCVGLKKSRYCILNKQYSAEAYESLRSEIIAYMKKTGEWGKFFPMSLAPFAYNESIAFNYYPLTEEQVKQRGWRWMDKDVKEYQLAHDDVLACGTCGKNYKLVDVEKQFYEKYNLSAPTDCPSCRMSSRVALRNSRQLWDRQCSCKQIEHKHQVGCANSIQTVYAPNRPEKVYCIDCYQKEL